MDTRAAALLMLGSRLALSLFSSINRLPFEGTW